MSQMCRTLGKGSAVGPHGGAGTPGFAGRTGKDGEMIFLLVAAAVVVAAPIVAAVLVTVASLREDAGRTLAGRPPGLLTAAVRRLLCFRTSARTSPPPPTLMPGDRGDLNRSYPEIPRPRSADSTDRTLTLPRS
jgi:hypothetical protein